MIFWSFFLLILVLFFTLSSVPMSKALPPRNTSEFGAILDIVNRFSYVMDLSHPHDAELFKSTPYEFKRALKPCVASSECIRELLKVTVKGMYDLFSYVTKDGLASGRFSHVTLKEVESTVWWGSTLLDIFLNSVSFKNASEIINCNETNPIHLATLFRMHNVLEKLLLLNGASLLINCKAPNMFNFTPLHISILNQDLNAVKRLCAHGADVESQDLYTRTPLKLAEDIHNQTVYNFLFGLMSNVSNHSDIFCGEDSAISDMHFSYQENSLLRSGDISENMAICNVETVYASNITLEAFVENYFSKRQPLIIKGATDNWRIKDSWKNASISNYFHNLSVLIGHIPYAEVFGKASNYVSMVEFFRYLNAYSETTKGGQQFPIYYAFDSDILEKSDKFFDSSLNPHPVWLLEALTRSSSYDEDNVALTKQFFWGPYKSGAPHHYHCDSVNSLVRGHKRWFLLPAAQAEYSNKDPLEWIKQTFSRIESDSLLSAKALPWSHKRFRNILSSRGVSEDMVVCDQFEGDMLYIPSFHGHATLNLEESIGIAFEFNRGNC